MKSLILVSVAITVAVAQRGEGPQCIQNFYDKMLNNPRRFGQNLTFIQENFHEDWNTRPNPLKPTGTYIFELGLVSTLFIRERTSNQHYELLYNKDYYIIHAGYFGKK